MSWKYFACVGPECDPVEASASRYPEKTMAWVEREMRNSEKGMTAWVCRVFRVSTDMKVEAVARYTKPIGKTKCEIVYHLETL